MFEFIWSLIRKSVPCSLVPDISSGDTMPCRILGLLGPSFWRVAWGCQSTSCIANECGAPRPVPYGTLAVLPCLGFATFVFGPSGTVIPLAVVMPAFPIRQSLICASSFDDACGELRSYSVAPVSTMRDGTTHVAYLR